MLVVTPAWCISTKQLAAMVELFRLDGVMLNFRVVSKMGPSTTLWFGMVEVLA
jgi:hypothetical protein